MTVRILGSNDLADSIGQKTIALMGCVVSGNLDYDVSEGFFYVNGEHKNRPIETGDYLHVDGMGIGVVALSCFEGGEFATHEAIRIIEPSFAKYSRGD